MVTSTGSGLSVPDWPNSYGDNMFLFPPSKWVGGILYEHVHRLIASTVGLLTIGLAVAVQRVDHRKWMRRLGWSALGVVIAQGLLGGMTVIFHLPTWISVFHACLAQTFFCIIVAIAVCTGPLWRNRPPERSRVEKGAMRVATVALTSLVFGQLFLGALMRHSHAGLAVPDFPLAYGRLLPGLSEADVAAYNHERAFTFFLPEVSGFQIGVHLLHRAGALIVIVAVIVALCVVIRRPAPGPIARPVMLAALLVAAQVGLGAWTVLSGKAPWIATAHVATGAILLGVSWTAVLRVIGFTRTARLPRTGTQSAERLCGSATIKTADLAGGAVG
ncbi:MAG: heme A synthase [Phycisphaerae bacterium]|nr:heme A synthase [Phycisphaerae bacterium]